MDAAASPPASSDFYLRIDDERCQLCRTCEAMRACRGRAVIRFSREEAPVIDVGRCMLCLACMDKCLFGAVARIEGR